MKESTSEFASIWPDVEAASPFPIPGRLAPAFAAYRDELVRFNAKINLIRFHDERELAVRHFLDSLAGLAFIPENARVADLGSGAGFPGAVIAIARPDLSVTLVEGTTKKTNFLRHLKRTLPLENVTVANKRWERMDLTAFDVLVTRAAWPPQDLAKMLVTLTRGVVLMWARESVENGEVVARYTLPGERSENLIVSLKGREP